MKISDRVHFSQEEEHKNARKVRKWHSVNYYETLCLYCAGYDIDFKTSDEDFDGVVELLSIHGQDDKSTDYYYFWID